MASSRRALDLCPQSLRANRCKELRQTTDKSNGCYKCGFKHGDQGCPVVRITCHECANVGHFLRGVARVGDNLNQGRRTKRESLRSKENGWRSQMVWFKVWVLLKREKSLLFDSGVTHSFISLDCMKRLNLSVSKLLFDLCVSTPAEVTEGGTVCEVSQEEATNFI